MVVIGITNIEGRYMSVELRCFNTGFEIDSVGPLLRTVLFSILCIAGADASGADIGVVDAKGVKDEVSKLSEQTLTKLPARIDAAWIRQMCDSGNTNALSLLEQAFHRPRETLEMEINSDQYLNAEILLAIGELKDVSSPNIIRRLVKETKAKGSRFKTQSWRDGAYITTMQTGIRLLGLTADSDSLRCLEELWKAPDLNQSLRSDAYRWYLDAQMRAKGVKEVSEIVVWLYDKYMEQSGAEKDCPVFVTLTIEKMLYMLGIAALPALDKKIQATEETYGSKYFGVLWLKHLVLNIKDNAENHQATQESGLPYWRNKRTGPERGAEVPRAQSDR